MQDQGFVSMYCPDCRGCFEIHSDDIIEEDVIECSLCGAEILIVQEHPIKVKLYSEEDDF